MTGILDGYYINPVISGFLLLEKYKYRERGYCSLAPHTHTNFLSNVDIEVKDSVLDSHYFDADPDPCSGKT